MGVGNEQVALAITRDSHGVRGERRVGRGSPVSEVACSATRDGGDDACGQVDSADAAVAYVGEVYGVVDEHGRSISLGWREQDGLNHRSKWRPHTGSVTFQQAESLPYLPVDEEVVHWFAEDFLRCSRVN